MFPYFNNCRSSFLCKQNSSVFLSIVSPNSLKVNGRKTRTILNISTSTISPSKARGTETLKKFPIRIPCPSTSIFFPQHQQKQRSNYWASILYRTLNSKNNGQRSAQAILYELSARGTLSPSQKKYGYNNYGEGITENKTLLAKCHENQNQFLNERSINSKNLDEWKQTCSRQCIFRILSSFIRLMYMIVHGLARMVFVIGKFFVGAKLTAGLREKAKEKAKEVGKTAVTKAGKSLMGGAKKSGILMARELPRVHQKMEKDAPIWSESIQKFAKYVEQELNQAKTPQQRFTRLFQIFENLVRTNRTVQKFALLLLAYGAFCSIRFFMPF